METRLQIYALNHEFGIGENGFFPDTAREDSRGLVASVRDGLVIYTGVWGGPVNVTVQTLDAEPEAVETDEWDEVAEITLTTASGNALLTSDGLAYADPGPLPLLTPHGQGTYRVRVHARHRDENYDTFAQPPYEDYLLITWPAPPNQERIFKETDDCGRRHRLRSKR